MSDCVTTALQLCFEMIRRRLVRITDDRPNIVGASWPIHVAVITQERIDTYSFDETDWRCRW